MKKVARLKWIEETFGKDFVLPYRVCHDLSEIFHAVSFFEMMAKKTWGMRTDFKEGSAQGFNLPFLHHGNMDEARKIWEEYKDTLVYIVSENVLLRRYSAVAIKLDSEHVLFEWNDKEPTISQRQMYKNLHNLRRLVVGPNNFLFREDGIRMRSVRPEYTADLKFDVIYDVMMHYDVDETTFTLRDDGKLVVW